MSPIFAIGQSQSGVWLWIALLGGSFATAIAVLLVAALLTPRGTEDRRYRDPPPWFWRLAWPVVRPLAERLSPRLPVSLRHRLNQRLQRAGLDFTLNPEQFVAGRLTAALFSALLVLVVWSPKGLASPGLLIIAATLGFALPASWLRDRIDHRARSVLKQLPFFLDLITLSVEAGMSLPGALEQAVEKGPRGVLRTELERALRDLRAGRGREEALRGFAERLALPAVAALVAALLLSEKQGGALGPVLRAQAEQRRNERFLRAEKLAMEAPVKMLPPLLVFIFPCTFVVLLFPVASRFIQEGWLR